MKNIVYIGFLMIGLVCCTNSVVNSNTENAIARVNDSYLFPEDLDGLILNGTSYEDSTLIINGYINRWATKQLLLSKAQLNIGEEEQKRLNDLVKDYKTDLLIRMYKDAIVRQNLDTIVDSSKLKSYYKENSSNFRLNEDLIQIRFIKTDILFNGIGAIEKALKNFSHQDKEFLREKSIHLNSYAFNDSVWFKLSDVYKKMPILTSYLDKNHTSKGKFTVLKDSSSVYMFEIKEILNRGQEAPLEYVKSTVNQIILNQRKLELIRELERDITTNAVNKKQFEIYNKDDE